MKLLAPKTIFLAGNGTKKSTSSKDAWTKLISIGNVAFAIFLLMGGHPVKLLAQCDPGVLIGEWQGSMPVDKNLHTYVFVFQEDGTYTYRIRQGKLQVTSHSGTYKLKELRKEIVSAMSMREFPWLCMITLTPNPKTIKTASNGLKSIEDLQKMSIFTTQQQSFQYRRLPNKALSFLDEEDGRNGYDGQTFPLLPVSK